MAELTPLSILITADADDLKAELSAARAALDKFDTAASKGAKGSTALGGALGKLGNVSGSTRAKIQMTSYQLQDIAVQMQMGTRASTVMAQQLPQLASAFGPVGAIVGTLAAVGIPALAFAFGGAEEEARDLEAAMSDFVAAGDEVKQLGDLLGLSAQEMAEKYGSAAEEIRKTAFALLELKQIEVERAFAEQVELLKEATREYTGYAATALRSGKSLTAAWQTVQKELGVSTEQAVALRDAFIEVGNAGTMEQQQVAMANLRDLLDEAGVEAKDLPPELFKALEHMYNLRIATEDVKNYLSDANANAGDLVGTLSKLSFSGIGAAGLGAGVGGGFKFSRGFASSDPPSINKNGSGGGARSNPLEAQLEALQNSLMSQEEAQIASFERQQETLRSALEQKLITQQEYNALMEDAQQQHADKMVGIDAYRYGDSLQAAGAFLGDMASALASGNEEMMRISKVFGAAEALVNAWRAASQALADPSIPVWGKFAAMAQVLAAGMGAVNAIKGVGKGGTGQTAIGSSGAGTIAPSGDAQAPAMNRSLTLIGDNFNRKQAIQIAEFLNEGSDDGLIVRGR